MVDFAHHLISKGYLEPPFYFNILLGSLGTMEADASNLVHLVSRLPEGSSWAVAGIGSRQFKANCLGLAMGGGVRVGLEYYDNGGRAQARLAWSSPSQARQIVPGSQLYPASLAAISGVGAFTTTSDLTSGPILSLAIVASGNR